MKVSINEIKKETLKRERLAYNGRTGNRVDVEILLSPLRAIYKVGKEGDESANIFSDLGSAIDKFNLLEDKDKRSCETCGVTEDSYCNTCEEYNKWFRKEAEYNKNKYHHCKLCGSHIEEDDLSICEKCASEYKF